MYGAEPESKLWVSASYKCTRGGYYRRLRADCLVARYRQLADNHSVNTRARGRYRIRPT